MLYDEKFFDGHSDNSLRSARVVVPLVLSLVRARSAIDVGCGTGPWLRALAENGVDDFLGLDGDYVQAHQLLIPPDRFRPTDLTGLKSPGRRFDLAVCLEVAEHLPAAKAGNLVRFLTEAAPMVLFSAATPGQGGTGHVNERWPWYWEGLFANCGYVRLDAIRPQIWRTPDVEPWYKTNIALYASEESIRSDIKLAEERRKTVENPFELVSSRVVREGTGSPRRLARAFFGAVWAALGGRKGGGE